MPESNGDNLGNRTNQELEVQEFVKKQFEMLFIRIDNLETEMRERFLQLSRQIRDLDIKVTFTPGSTRI